MITTKEILAKAKKASVNMITLTTEQKRDALCSMADALIRNTDKILEKNVIDIEKAKGVISDVMIDRLMLTKERIRAMAEGIINVSKLPDPVGKVLDENLRDDGLLIRKVSVPMGVVGIIYESRPNVTSDAAALCVMSGNACVLRGGKEAFESSNEIVNAMKEGLREANICEDVINLIQDTSRESANEMMVANDFIDILIPRGGAGLINACVKNATVPCIHTGTGICHIYIEKSADLETAVRIIENAKTSRPSVCNAAEVLLIDEEIAAKLLPMVKNALVDKRIANGLNPVELRLCEKAVKIIGGRYANEDDFDTEFLDYILAVKIVDGVDSAIEHINAHSTSHSEAIITQDSVSSRKFTRLVDSSSVYVNASTRFTDGGEFGLGCEMGISTQKLHARGPMGLKELTTYKYIIKGNGNIR